MSKIKKLGRFLLNNPIPVLLILFSLLIYGRWLGPGIFTYSDWGYQALVARSHFSSSIWISTNGIGAIDYTFWLMPTNLLFALLSHLASYSLTTKLVYFWPVIITGAIGSYYFLSTLVKSRTAILLGSLVYIFNTYFLSINTQGHMLLTFAANIALIALTLFLRAVNEQSYRKSILGFAALALAGTVDFRSAYIILGVIIIYILFKLTADSLKKEKESMRTSKLISYFLSGFAIFVGLNFFWALPALMTGNALNNPILERGLFGNQFWNLLSAMSLHHPFWNGTKPAWFHVQAVPFYFWLVPLIAILGLIFNRKNKMVIWFGLIAVIGIFLSKQADSPFPSAYPWLFKNIIGFDAFREPTKFYLLTIIAYSALTAYFVQFLQKSFRERRYQIGIYILIAIVSSVLLCNAKPYLSGSIGTMFVRRHIPSDYLKWEQFISSQKNYSRILWAPIYSRWSYSSPLHPNINTVDQAQLEGNIFSYSNKDLSLPLSVATKNVLNQNLTEMDLSLADVKYVVVPLRDISNDDNFFKSYGDDRRYYVDLLDSLPWLKKVDIGTKDLEVYENQNYKLYFSTSTNLNDVNSLDNLDQVYQFAQSQLKDQDFEFNISKTIKNNQAGVTDLFNGLNRGELKQGSALVQNHTNQNNSLSVYANNNRPVIDYQLQNGSLNFYAQQLAGPQVGNASSILVQGSNQAIGSVPLSGGEYYINVNTDLLKVDPAQPNRNLGVLSQAPAVVQADKTNMVPDPLLQKGLWQSRVGDCNDYDNSGWLAMWLSKREKTIGNLSLALGAGNHTACSGPDQIAVTPGANYLMSFDYKVQNGQQAGFEVDFIDSKVHPYKKYLYINDNNWRNFSGEIKVPADARAIKILYKGYPDNNRKNYAITYYDNFRLSQLTQVGAVNYDFTPRYTKTSLASASSLTVNYTDKTLNYKNLIQNADFKDGLWQKQVGDCNDYDDKAKLGMQLSPAHSIGAQQSLELDATRHIACTNPAPVAVSENNPYLLSFDYQSPNADNAGYYVSFNDSARTVVAGQLPITDANWHNFTKTITTPYGATQMSLTVYSYSADLGNKKIITRYDNFYAAQVPNIQDQYYLVSTPKAQLKQPKAINFTLNSPTKKTVNVKGATTPFYLAMSEAYDPHWQLELNDGNIRGLNSWLPTAHPHAVAAANHIDLNDFENGWYVDPAALCQAHSSACVKNADGSYNLQMVAEFTPQRWFYIGLIISGTTLIGCVTYLIVDRRKGRHPKPHKYEVSKK